MRRPGVVFTRKQLLHDVWGEGRSIIEQSVDVFIMHLRNKLEVDPTNPKLIRCARGFGYSFECLSGSLFGFLPAGYAASFKPE